MLYSVELLPRVISGNSDSNSHDHLWREATAHFGSTPTRLERHALFLLEFAEGISAEDATRATQRAAERLFTDNASQTYQGGPVDQYFETLSSQTSSAVILASNRPGVTDAEGESAKQGYEIMAAGSGEALPAIKGVHTAALYYLDFAEAPNREKLHEFARRFLVNELVEDARVCEAGQFDATALTQFAQAQFDFQQSGSATVRSIELRQLDAAGLEKII